MTYVGAHLQRGVETVDSFVVLAGHVKQDSKSNLPTHGGEQSKTVSKRGGQRSRKFCR